MKTYRLLALVLAAAILAACSITTGSGKVITESRTVGEFTRVELTCSADVVIVQGSPQAVSVEGEDNIVPLIQMRVSGGTLIIDTRPNAAFSTHKPLIVHITASKIDGLQATGSGDIELDKLTAASVKIETTGSGDIHLVDLQADSVQAVLSGSGEITIDGGKTASQKVTTSGSGSYNAARLQSSSTDATASGSGDITVWATDTLSASTSGSGDIRYYGAAKTNTNSSGSGSVEKVGDNP